MQAESLIKEGRTPPCAISEYKKRLPNAILIGERKTGTAKIVKFLVDVNPMVHRPPDGEPHFFDHKRISFKNLNLTEYKLLMSPSCPNEITIEKTPSYFRTSGAANKIRQMNKDTKILLALRDPIKRALSDFYFEIRKLGNENFENYHYANHTFEELVFKANGEVDDQFGPVNRSLYDVNLARWLKHFPLKQIHVIDADAFSHQNPALELAKVEQFLGLEPKSRPNMFYQSPSGYYCMVGTEFERGEKGHSHPPIAKQAIQALRKYFAPHVKALVKQLGWKLSWMDAYLQLDEHFSL